MSMKSTTSPRRVYIRNGVTHVLYAGDWFGTKEESSIVASTKHLVKIEGNGDGTITVSQRGGKGLVTEKWGKVRVPTHARDTKPAKRSAKAPKKASKPRARKEQVAAAPAVVEAAPAPAPAETPVIPA